MSNEAPGSGFSEQAKRALTSVLDEIIPPSSDGKFPGAGQLGVASYIETALRKLPELRSMILEGLTDLDRLAQSRGATDFAGLAREDKLQLLNQQTFVFPLTFQTYAGYYQDAQVVKALGLEARPPHPKGYEMEPNDLTLLDEVRRRSKQYREC